MHGKGRDLACSRKSDVSLEIEDDGYLIFKKVEKITGEVDVKEVEMQRDRTSLESSVPGNLMKSRKNSKLKRLHCTVNYNG